MSEIVFTEAGPKLVLGWIDLAGLRTPIWLELDPAKLKRARGLKNTWCYDQDTEDPRFADMQPLPDADAPGSG